MQAFSGDLQASTEPPKSIPSTELAVASKGSFVGRFSQFASVTRELNQLSIAARTMCFACLPIDFFKRGRAINRNRREVGRAGVPQAVCYVADGPIKNVGQFNN
jgi:hypothetical protein